MNDTRDIAQRHLFSAFGLRPATEARLVFAKTKSPSSLRTRACFVAWSNKERERKVELIQMLSQQGEATVEQIQTTLPDRLEGLTIRTLLQIMAARRKMKVREHPQSRIRHYAR